MFCKVRAMWTIVGMVICITYVQGMTRMWDYTILSFDITSTNEDICKTDVHLERINRNDYAVAGTVELKQDIGDDYIVYAETYRSTSGVGEYFKMPFAFHNQTLSDFMRTSYRQSLMNSVIKCSNLPVVDENFKGPFPANTYRFNSCTLDADNYPPYIQEGYYKILFNVVGPYSLTVEALIKIDKK